MKTIKITFGFIVISVLFVFIIIVNKNTNIDMENSLSEKNLNGKVRSLKIISYNVEFIDDEIVKGRIIDEGYYYEKFNKYGMEIEHGWIDNDGKSVSQVIMRYDEEQNIISVDLFEYPDKYTSGICEYNKDGTLKESKSYDDDNKLTGYDTYEYDLKGNMTQKSWFDSDGNAKYEWIYEYDEKGNLIQLKGYDLEKNSESINTYNYDLKGNEIENIWYDSEGRVVLKYMYEYDDFNNMIKEEMYYSEAEDSKVYTYIYEYLYDGNGNWIEKIKYENGTPSRIVEREIIYY